MTYQHKYIWVGRDSSGVTLWTPSNKPKRIESCDGCYFRGTVGGLLCLDSSDFHAVFHWTPPSGTLWKMVIDADVESVSGLVLPHTPLLSHARGKKLPFIWLERRVAPLAQDADIAVYSPGKGAKQVGALLDKLCPQGFQGVMHWVPPEGTTWKMWIYFEAEEVSDVPIG